MSAAAAPETEMAKTTELQDRESNLELLHTEVKQRLESQSKAIERIETKAVVMAGFSVTAVQFVLSRQAHTAVWVVALALFALSFVAALGVISLTKYQDPPNPAALVERYQEVRRADTLGSLIGIKVEAYAKNASPAKRKVVLSWASAGLLVAGLGLATVNGGRTVTSDEQRAARDTRRAAIEASRAAAAARDAARSAEDAARITQGSPRGAPTSTAPGSPAGS